MPLNRTSACPPRTAARASLLLLCLLLLLLMPARVAGQNTQGPAVSPPIRILMVTGDSDLPHHHWRETTAAIQEIFQQHGGFDVRVLEDARAVTNEVLNGYDALLMNYHGPRLPRAAEQAIEGFVSGGGGLVAFHQACYGPFFGMVQRDGRWFDGDPAASWTAWSKMIGAQWPAADLGHAIRGPFLVNWRESSPLAPPGERSFLANDELYHKLRLLPGAEVQASAHSLADQGGTGNTEPLVWTNRYGKGRVVFTSLGHDAMAFHQPGMRSLFVRGAAWAAARHVPHPRAAAPLRVLVVTGGHSYPVEFYTMLASLDGVRWVHATSHEEAFARPLEDRFDVLLLHDMIETTTPRTRERLRTFVEAGKGVVSLHHAIVNYTDWPWWHQEVTGGKYFVRAEGGHAASRYQEGVDFTVQPATGKRNHPVLAGVGPLTVHDEVYKTMWLSPQIEILMETDHPENDRPVVYVGPHPKARAVYVQLGHSSETMTNPGFRRLVRNALFWAARQQPK